LLSDDDIEWADILAPHLTQLGVDPDKRVLLYSGNIGLIGNLGKAWRR